MRQSQLEAHEKTLNQVIGGLAKAYLEKTGERTPEPCREEIPFLDDNLVYFRRVSNQPEEKLRTKLLDLISIFSKSFFLPEPGEFGIFLHFVASDIENSLYPLDGIDAYALPNYLSRLRIAER